MVRPALVVASETDMSRFALFCPTDSGLAIPRTLILMIALSSISTSSKIWPCFQLLPAQAIKFSIREFNLVVSLENHFKVFRALV